MNINPRWQVNRVDMHEFLCRPGEIFRRPCYQRGRGRGKKETSRKMFIPSKILQIFSIFPWMIDEYFIDDRVEDRVKLKISL